VSKINARRAAVAPDTATVECSSLAMVTDALTGGHDNYALDRSVATELRDAAPEQLVRAAALASVTFRGAVVRRLAGQGIRKFIDWGPCIPRPVHRPDTYAIARRANPSCRVAFVDVDSHLMIHLDGLVDLSESRSLLTLPAGRLGDANAVLDDPEVRRVIDIASPVAVLLAGTVGRLGTAQAQKLVDVLRRRLAPGSYLAISQYTSTDPVIRARTTAILRGAAGGAWGGVRAPKQVAALFRGLEVQRPSLLGDVGAWTGEVGPWTSFVQFGGLGRITAGPET